MKKKILAVTLIMMLAVTSLSGCGADKEDKVPTSLSKTLKVTSIDGLGTKALDNLDGDYKKSVSKDAEEVSGKILNGDVDGAIMSPTTAAQLNSKTSNEVVEISPISIGDLYVVQNSYVQASRTVRVYNEETKLSEYKEEKIETKMGFLRGKTIVAYGKPGDVSQYVLQNLALKEGYFSIPDENIEWIDDEDKFIERMGNYQTIGLASKPVVSKLLKENTNVKKVFDLNSKWKDHFDGDIPMNVLLVTKDLAKNKDDLRVFLNDLGKAIDKAKEGGDKNLVLYTESSRGVSILKKFNNAMYDFSAEVMGNEKPKDSFYYSR
ncbi:MAG: hypothetical protein RR967_02125 [Anaerovoracaceae bacterium]